jgi:hypothetical protein
MFWIYLNWIDNEQSWHFTLRQALLLGNVIVKCIHKYKYMTMSLCLFSFENGIKVRIVGIRILLLCVRCIF